MARRARSAADAPGRTGPPAHHRGAGDGLRPRPRRGLGERRRRPGDGRPLASERRPLAPRGRGHWRRDANGRVRRAEPRRRTEDRVRPRRRRPRQRQDGRADGVDGGGHTRRRVRRDGLLGARTRAERRARGHPRSERREPGGGAARRRSAVRRRAGGRGHAEPRRLPLRAGRRARGRGGHGRARRGASRRLPGGGRADSGGGERRNSGRGVVLALHLLADQRRERRAVAGLAAEESGGRGASLHQQRGGRHQLRNAGVRAAAARLRSGRSPRREDHRPPRRRGRALREPRRAGARAAPPYADDRRPGARDRARRRDGRRELRNDRVHAQRAAGVGDVQRDQHAADGECAEIADGRLAALREGAEPGTGGAGAAPRHAPHFGDGGRRGRARRLRRVPRQKPRAPHSVLPRGPPPPARGGLPRSAGQRRARRARLRGRGRGGRRNDGHASLLADGCEHRRGRD